MVKNIECGIVFDKYIPFIFKTYFCARNENVNIMIQLKPNVCKKCVTQYL